MPTIPPRLRQLYLENPENVAARPLPVQVHQRPLGAINFGVAEQAAKVWFHVTTSGSNQTFVVFDTTSERTRVPFINVELRVNGLC